jgi:hypothetical protein
VQLAFEMKEFVKSASISDSPLFFNLLPGRLRTIGSQGSIARWLMRASRKGLVALYDGAMELRWPSL